MVCPSGPVCLRWLEETLGSSTHNGDLKSSLSNKRCSTESFILRSILCGSFLHPHNVYPNWISAVTKFEVDNATLCPKKTFIFSNHIIIEAFRKTMDNSTFILFDFKFPSCLPLNFFPVRRHPMSLSTLTQKQSPGSLSLMKSMFVSLYLLQQQH